MLAANNLVKSDAQWKRIQERNAARKFANRSDAVRRGAKVKRHGK